MKLSRASTLPQVAVVVGEQLARRGIRAVLTGGACVAFYTGTYTSKDAGFVLQGHVTQRGLDEAMHPGTTGSPSPDELFWPVT